MITELFEALLRQPRFAIRGLEYLIEGSRLWLRHNGTSLGCWRQAEDLSWPHAPDVLVYEDKNGTLNLFESLQEALAHLEHVILPDIKDRLN